jgi:fucose 4-O-acetylase-like acetyltransferase
MDGSAAEQIAPVVRERATGRVEFLAAARGGALLYIVLGHVVDWLTIPGAPTSAAWDQFLGVYNAADHMTAGTRIGILVFMTGVFLERSVTRGLVHFVSTRATSLLWPLLLWGLLQAAYFAYAPWPHGVEGFEPREGFARLWNGLLSLNPLEVLRGWWRLSAPLWFLNMLAFFLAAFLLLRLLPKYFVLVGAVALFVFSVATPPPAESNPELTALLVLGPNFLYFWLGTLSYDWVARRNARITLLQALACLAAFLAIALPPVLLGREDWARFGYVASLPAIPLMLMGARLLLHTPLKWPLLWAGKSSLLILCLHMMTLSLAMLAAAAAGVVDPLWLLPLSFAGALGLCLLADLVLQRVGWSGALGFRRGG